MKNDTFTPRTEILPPAQRSLWKLLAPARSLGFVLYGGTAIALRLGHRPSVDFDFFSEKPLDHDAVRAAFPFMKNSTLLQQDHDSMHMLVSFDRMEAHVKLSFFGEITFGRTGTPQITDDGVIEVASIPDLMATKVKVILQRAEAKDYRDIAAMLAAGVPLIKGLAAARTMFGSAFQPSESLKAMVYFGDGDLHTLSREERTTLVHAVDSLRGHPIPAMNLLSRKLSGDRDSRL